MHSLKLLLIVVGLVITFQYALAAPLTNAGLKDNFIINANNNTFKIETVSNFGIVDVVFDQNNNTLRFEISNGTKNNLAEILIPKGLSPEGFSFYLNGENFSPTIKSNEQIFFVTLKFNGTGPHVFEAKLNEPKPSSQAISPDDSSGVNYLYIGIAIAIGAGISATVLYKSKKRK